MNSWLQTLPPTGTVVPVPGSAPSRSSQPIPKLTGPLCRRRSPTRCGPGSPVLLPLERVPARPRCFTRGVTRAPLPGGHTTAYGVDVHTAARPGRLAAHSALHGSAHSGSFPREPAHARLKNNLSNSSIVNVCAPPPAEGSMHSRRPVAMIVKPARSNAFDTAASWVTTSLQPRPSSIIPITPPS